jgi:hypothetical protein
MSKTRLISVVLVIFLAGLTYAGKGEKTTSSEAKFWIGKQRDEVISMLGPPSKSKKRGKGEILIYLREVEWYATATSPDGQIRDAVDEHGDGTGAGSMDPGAGPIRAVFNKLKLYLDENEKVYKVKAGKRR